jgi:hypothetical protein
MCPASALSQLLSCGPQRLRSQLVRMYRIRPRLRSYHTAQNSVQQALEVPAHWSLSYYHVDPSARVASYCVCPTADPAHAATTPCKNSVERALEPYLYDIYNNRSKSRATG